MTLGWTDERVELAKKLWQDGLSASQISKQIGGGLSRNAVIGKLYRLGLTGRGGATRKTPSLPLKPSLMADLKRPRRTIHQGDGRRLAAPKLKPQALPPLRCVEVEPKRVPFIERTSDECAFILDGEDLVCCGLPVVERHGRRLSYCAAHADLTSNGLGAKLDESFYAGLGPVLHVPVRRERVAEL